MLEGSLWDGVGFDLTVEVVATVATTQTGRLRVAEALNRGLAWRVGERLAIARAVLSLHDGRPVPALIVAPTRRASDARMTVNPERRITIPQEDRDHLGVDEHGDEVLVAFHLGELDRAVLIGAGGLSAILFEVWPRGR